MPISKDRPQKGLEGFSLEQLRARMDYAEEHGGYANGIPQSVIGKEILDRTSGKPKRHREKRVWGGFRRRVYE